MRLIDADAINTKTFVDFVGNQGYISFDDALWMISKQPTVYNVEEVVKEVSEIGVWFCDSVECCDGCDDCEQGSLMRAILDAIRKGGVK